MRAYKTEIKPSLHQKQLLSKTFGNCRYVYNQYLAHNQQAYKETGKFITGYDFSKLINNSVETPKWLKETSSKATKQAIIQAETAFKRFFNNQSGFPKFKKRGKSKDNAYFVGTIKVQRHRIFIPTLKWVRLKEFGYIPNKGIKSVTLSKAADRYYVSVLVDEAKPSHPKPINDGIGIDLGIKDFATLSNGEVYKNINKSPSVKKLEKKLKREQRIFSKKLLNKKQRGGTAANIQKQKLVIQKLHRRLYNIRTDYINKTVSSIVKQKPSFITLETLNIKGMVKNRHLSKAISQQKFYELKVKLTNKCRLHNIELREVGLFYPSSKLCSSCGNKKAKLSLSERIYKCSCGLKVDRDLNASINLKNATGYTVLT